MNRPPPLIGVIDLRGGRAVHAIAGQRRSYREVLASDVSQGNAVQLAARYRRLGIQSLYIADLDAISGNGTNQDLITQISSLTENLFIDAGAASTAIAAATAEAHMRFILPTESFASTEAWAAASNQIGGDRTVLGLDLQGVQVRTGGDPRGGAAVEPERSLMVEMMENISPWIDRAASAGVQSMVVLDLAFVGTAQGAGTCSACRAIAQRWPDLELISGGGVRNAMDVQRLLAAGCDRVLLATALHNDVSAASLTAQLSDQP